MWNIRLWFASTGLHWFIWSHLIKWSCQSLCKVSSAWLARPISPDNQPCLCLCTHQLHSYQRLCARNRQTDGSWLRLQPVKVPETQPQRRGFLRRGFSRGGNGPIRWSSFSPWLEKSSAWEMFGASRFCATRTGEVSREVIACGLEEICELCGCVFYVNEHVCACVWQKGVHNKGFFCHHGNIHRITFKLMFAIG